MRIRRFYHQRRIMCLIMICVWSFSSVLIFWKKIKQYDHEKRFRDSIQRSIEPFDVTRLKTTYFGGTREIAGLEEPLDTSSAEEGDHFSGYNVNFSASDSYADTPTIKLRHIVKSKVDYGRDRDLDVEGVNDYLLWYENFQNNLPRLPTLPRQQKCTKPVQNVAFIKTHHTGSDVITNILNRYGDLNYLNVALPSDGLPTFFWPMRFQWKYIDITMLNGSLPNIICNHARYNNDVMDNILNPGSVYVTILRDPVSQLETTFNNMGFGGLLQVTNTTDQLLTFLKSPKHYIQGVIRRKRFKDTLNLIKNAQFFDLGLSTTEYHRKNVIKMTIQELYEKFTLVLIYEYLDESLVLMKRRLCWQLDDIIYLKFHYTNHDQWNRKGNYSAELSDRVRAWNQADVYLYDFFNKTLWKEIEFEGDDFWKELKEFRLNQNAMEENCIRTESTSLPKDEKFALSDVPTTPRVMTSSSTTDVISTAVSPSSNTHTTNRREHLAETSGDIMYVHKNYKKTSNRTLRDVLVRSKVIRDKSTVTSNKKNNKQVKGEGSFDKNNNLTPISRKGEKENSAEHDLRSQAGNLYTDTNEVFGSGTGKTLNKVISNVQRMLSRTVTPWDTYLCKKLLMTEVEYLDYFRKKHVHAHGKASQRK